MSTIIRIYTLLQMFADAGNLVNATGSYVNAYTGATTAFDSKNSLSGELKTFYDTELLENARIGQYYGQFGKKVPLPANNGKTVEFRKWNTFPKAAVLAEGVIPTGQKFGMSSKTGSIIQHGLYATISDELELRAYDDVILGATEEMGASAAETSEYLIRDALLVNTNVMYCDNIAPDGTYKSTPNGPATMGASNTDGYALLTPDAIAKAVTIMKKNKAPTINGKYFAVIHPSVAYDLRKSEGWLEAHKYASPEEIYNGEIGELHGVRFIESVVAPVLGGSEHTDYNNKAGGKTYATYLFSKESFGIIDAAGGALQMIVHDKNEIGGPLNQFSTIGYKMSTNGATILYPERLLRIMSVSSFSATDGTNYYND